MSTPWNYFNTKLENTAMKNALYTGIETVTQAINDFNNAAEQEAALIAESKGLQHQIDILKAASDDEDQLVAETVAKYGLETLDGKIASAPSGVGALLAKLAVITLPVASAIVADNKDVSAPGTIKPPTDFLENNEPTTLSNYLKEAGNKGKLSATTAAHLAGKYERQITALEAYKVELTARLKFLRTTASLSGPGYIQQLTTENQAIISEIQSKERSKTGATGAVIASDAGLSLALDPADVTGATDLNTTAAVTSLSGVVKTDEVIDQEIKVLQAKHTDNATKIGQLDNEATRIEALIKPASVTEPAENNVIDKNLAVLKDVVDWHTAAVVQKTIVAGKDKTDNATKAILAADATLAGLDVFSGGSVQNAAAALVAVQTAKGVVDSKISGFNAKKTYDNAVQPIVDQVQDGSSGALFENADKKLTGTSKQMLDALLALASKHDDTTNQDAFLKAVEKDGLDQIAHSRLEHALPTQAPVRAVAINYETARQARVAGAKNSTAVGDGAPLGADVKVMPSYFDGNDGTNALKYDASKDRPSVLIEHHLRESSKPVPAAAAASGSSTPPPAAPPPPMHVIKISGIADAKAFFPKLAQHLNSLTGTSGALDGLLKVHNGKTYKLVFKIEGVNAHGVPIIRPLKQEMSGGKPVGTPIKLCQEYDKPAGTPGRVLIHDDVGAIANKVSEEMGKYIAQYKDATNTDGYTVFHAAAASATTAATATTSAIHAVQATEPVKTMTNKL